MNDTNIEDTGTPSSPVEAFCPSLSLTKLSRSCIATGNAPTARHLQPCAKPSYQQSNDVAYQLSANDEIPFCVISPQEKKRASG